MFSRFYLITIVIFIFFSCSSKQDKGKPDKIESDNYLVVGLDTLREIKWKKLNEFVSYVELHNAKDSCSDSLLNLKLISRLKNGKYDQEYWVTSTSNITSKEWSEYISGSGLFDNGKKVDYLFNINPEIAYKQRPDLLDTVWVHLKEESKEAVVHVERELRKKPFVSFLQLDSMPLNEFDTLNREFIRNKFFRITFKNNNHDLNQINKYCKDLDSIKYVYKAFFNSVFTDYSKTNIIYRVWCD